MSDANAVGPVVVSGLGPASDMENVLIVSVDPQEVALLFASTLYKSPSAL